MSSILRQLSIFCLIIFSFSAHADMSKIKKMKSELNLTQEQLQQISEIKKKYSDDLKKLKKATCEKRMAMQDAFNTDQKGEAFQKILNDKFVEFRNSKNEERLLQFKMAVEIREILNTEQIVKFNEMHVGHGAKNKFKCGGE